MFNICSGAFRASATSLDGMIVARIGTQDGLVSLVSGDVVARQGSGVKWPMNGR